MGYYEIHFALTADSVSDLHVRQLENHLKHWEVYNESSSKHFIMQSAYSFYLFILQNSLL